MEKKLKNIFIKFLCMAVFITAMTVICVHAEANTQNPSPSIGVQDLTVSRGSYGTLSVTVKDFTAVAGMEFSIHYDENLFTDLSYWQSWLAPNATMDVNITTPGEIKCSFLDVEGINGSGELLCLSFRVPESMPIGTYSIQITVGDVYDTEMSPVNVKKQSGKISVVKESVSESNIEFFTEISSDEIKSGDTFTYTLYGGWTEGLSGGNFICEYDRDFLELQEISLGEVLKTSTAITSVNSEKAGYIKVSHGDIYPISENYGETYLTLNFKAKNNVSGDTEIRFTANGLVSSNMSDLKTSEIKNTIHIIDREKAPKEALVYLQYDEEKSTRKKYVVDVVIDSASGVAAGDFVVNYTTWILNCVQVDIDEAVSNAPGAYLITKEDTSQGEVRFSYVNTDPFTEAQAILSLTFEVTPWFSGDVTVDLTGKGVVNKGFENLDVTYESLTRYIDSTPLYIHDYTFLLESSSLTYNGKEQKPVVTNSGGLKENVDYTVTYVDNVSVGWGNVYIEGIGDYEGTIYLSFYISPDTIENKQIQLEYESIAYDGSEKRPSVQIPDLDPSTDYDVVYSNNVYAGQATVIVRGKGNYTGEVFCPFEITPASIKKESIHIDYETTFYNGTEKQPDVQILGLVQNVDYEVVYSNNVNVGTATVTIKGKGNYGDEAVYTFEIKPVDINNKVINLDYDSTVYAGSAKKPSVEIYGLNQNIDYEVVYENNVNVGTATVTVRGKGNYTGEAVVTFEIVAANIADKVALLSYETVIYDGLAKLPSVQIDGLTENKDYEVVYKDNVNAGTATVTVKGKGNYTGVVVRTFAITAADINDQLIHLEYATTVYDGTAKEPSVQITGLKQNTDYEVVYKNNVNVGTATVTVRGKGNYTGQVVLTFTITAADIAEKEVSLSYETVVYDGAEKTPVVQVAGLTENSDYEVIYENNKDVGTASVTVKGKGNYTGAVVRTFAITAADIAEKEITLSYETVIYEGLAKKPSVQIDGLNQNVDYEVVYENNINVGTATVTVSGKGNYTGVVTLTFTITPESIANKDITLSYESVTYDGTAKTPSVNISGLTENIDYEVVYENNVNAGTATVTVSGRGNYSGEVELTFTIETADVYYQLNNLEYYTTVYDGSAKEPSVQIIGLNQNVDYEVFYENNINAGTATVTVNGIGNYTGQVVLTFNIIPAEITDKDITLSYESVTYDGTEKKPSVIIDGLTENIDYEVIYENNINAGWATVTVKGKGNYTGRDALPFLITVADINDRLIDLDYDTVAYDGTAKTPGVQIDGLVQGVDYEVIYGDNVDVGTATVMVIGRGNYTGEVVLTFTITVVNINNQVIHLGYDTTLYDGTAKEPSVQIDGLTENKDYEVVYKDNVNAGTASVTVKGKGNYTGQVVLTFAITAADIAEKEITLSYETVVYDGTEKTPGVQVAGLTENSDYEVIYENNKDAGTASVTVRGKGNYTGVIVLTFEITSADIGEIGFELTETEFEYDGKEKCPKVTTNSSFIEGIDYEVTYTNNIEVGTAIVEIRGINNCAGTVLLEFTIKEQVKPTLPFVDVSEGKWYYNAVKWVFERGLLTGTSDTEFSPNDPMTRGMLVTVLYRMEGRPEVLTGNKFPDVNVKKYYASAITWASEQNIVSGYSNGKFGPEDSITREQLAKVLYLYADYKGYDVTAKESLSAFNDASNVSSYAKKYMQWAVAEGLIKGSNGKLKPKGEATRAEIAAILKRFVENYN